MRKTDTTVYSVEKGSLAEQAGIRAGDKLLTINGSDFYDILEYRYLTAEYELTLEVEKQDGSVEMITVESDYEDLGISFASDLIDEAQSCRNKCIFCFIDQLPPNMRETVYFKDDDTRLSFLQGNYVTLTNLSEEEIDRMIRMRISPINISVHATNPAVREKMLGNRFAGKLYATMQKFARHEIYMNCQIVLCPGINDGMELDRTLHDLAALHPYVNSVSVVPVGLTRYREGLFPLKPFDRALSEQAIRQVQRWQDIFLEHYGTRLVYLSDEFYINAGISVPDPQAYEGFPQLENGVGLVASMQEEFEAALQMIPEKTWQRRISIATGELAAPFIQSISKKLEQHVPGIQIRVYPVKNDFFGGGVNVAGLVCGGDMIRQLKGKELGEALLIPSSMLREDDEIFLDDVTVAQVETALGIQVVPVLNDGYEFVEKVLGEELVF